jgi:hypothetical protein
MYGADDYGDEDERRRARGQDLFPPAPPVGGHGHNANSGSVFDHGYNPNGGPDTSGWTDGYGVPNDGIGSPESGYGPSGVENPAYTGGITKAAPIKPDLGGPPPPPPGPAPGPTGGNPNQPAFQPPAAMAPPQAAAPAGVRTPPITDEVTKILMARLNELKNPGDVQNDPIYQNAVRAYQVQALRSADRQRKALAERSAASGTRASGGFNVGVRGINERAGENAAQYTSGLALDRLTAREQQLTQAIQMARSVGQDDIANQLEVQRLQLQAELGRGDLALRGELGRGQLNLGQDNLGFNYADLISRMNRDAVLAGLGGG